MNLFRIVQVASYHLPAVVPTARRQGAAVRSRISGIAIAFHCVTMERT
ncbi:MAG: hypothetical protein ABSD46_05595 [Bacteroidota bacterium]